MEEQRECPQCKRKVPAEVPVCPHCSHDIRGEEERRRAKAQWQSATDKEIELTGKNAALLAQFEDMRRQQQTATPRRGGKSLGVVLGLILVIAVLAVLILMSLPKTK
jgi:hypothetical protein